MRKLKQFLSLLVLAILMVSCSPESLQEESPQTELSEASAALCADGSCND